MLIVTSLFLAPGTAVASAEGCTLTPGGIGSFQCMGLAGARTTVKSVTESYSYGSPYSNVCGYQARWLGDNAVTGWTK